MPFPTNSCPYFFSNSISDMENQDQVTNLKKNIFLDAVYIKALLH